MRTTFVTIGIVIAVAAIPSAQTAPSDEQQIRALIAKINSGEAKGISTKDSIFWSGAIKRPVIGPQQGEEVPDDTRPSDRKPGSQRVASTIVRIEVAKSGDLAYEYSDRVLSVEMKDGRKESFPSSVLRVWKKEAGQWKVAAHFSHAHEP